MLGGAGFSVDGAIWNRDRSTKIEMPVSNTSTLPKVGSSTALPLGMDRASKALVFVAELLPATAAAFLTVAGDNLPVAV